MAAGAREELAQAEHAALAGRRTSWRRLPPRRGSDARSAPLQPRPLHGWRRTHGCVRAALLVFSLWETSWSPSTSAREGGGDGRRTASRAVRQGSGAHGPPLPQGGDAGSTERPPSQTHSTQTQSHRWTQAQGSRGDTGWSPLSHTLEVGTGGRSIPIRSLPSRVVEEEATGRRRRPSPKHANRLRAFKGQTRLRLQISCRGAVAVAVVIR